MLFSNVILPVHVPLQRREDIALLDEILPTLSLDVNKWVVGDTILISRR